MKKLCWLLVVVVLLFGITSCGENGGVQPEDLSPEEDAYYEEESAEQNELPDQDGNPYTTHEMIDGEIIVSYDYSEAYETLDFSQYTDHGSFSPEGLMWVEKSDYTGKQFGYIDYTGKLVVPFTSEIVEPGDFDNGYAIVSYEIDGFGMGNGLHGIIDTKGNVVLKFDNHAVSKHYISDNGNIVLTEVQPMGDVSVVETDTYSNNYVYCKEINKVVQLPERLGNSLDDFYYSDGLLRTYTTEDDPTGDAGDFHYVANFYDENGEIALTIKPSDNEYYSELIYVDDFKNGEAILTFYGLDREFYNVKIDKTGSWIGEPQRVIKDEVSFFN